MKLISCNNVETNRYQLEVAVDAKDFNDAIERAYQKDKRKISLPGFRKGKAPRAFIEKYYGQNVFFEDAIEDLYPKALDDAITEAKLEVIEDKIDFEIVEVSKEKGLTFKATVTTKPEVNIKDYLGLKITPKSVEVTDADVDAKMNELLDRYSRMVTVDRGAENDDIVVMDFEGFLDGEPFEGGKAENYSLTLGTKMFIPGFEEQLCGHKAGEDVEVNVTFPEDYHASELAGKPTVFKVHIHEVKGKELPELDDEFVKDISDFDTVADLRADMRKRLEEMKKEEVAGDIEYQLMMQLNDRLEGEIPNAMYEKQIDTEIRAFNYRLQSQGLRFETYMQLTGQDPHTLRESFRQQAENQVKIRLALEKIGELENITATDEEIDEEFENLAKMYQQDVEKVKEMISREGQAKDVVARKAMNLVRDNAVVVPAEEAAKAEEAPAEEKKPAKKPAAKKTTKKAAEGEEGEKPAKKPAAKRTTKKAAEGEEAEKKPAKKPAAKKTTKKAEEKTEEQAEKTENAE
ncbi:MAG: trigger factor [Oscillospiraceae bacterium]|nr:trigger factor [Oscillospiraceae bacterium]